MKLAIASLALVASAANVRADGFRALAKDLSVASSRPLRVAILPFDCAQGDASAGKAIAEKLTTQIVRVGRLQAVERALLPRIVDEHSLGQTGLLDPGTVKRLGRLLAVDALIAGSFVDQGSRVVINARLIDVETGLILAASERKAPRDWEPPREAISPLAETPSDELRDAPMEISCEDAADRADSMERQILDIKARYWAGRLKSGVKTSDVKVNPGETINDPGLKSEFYRKLKDWYAQPEIPSLSSSEIRRFVALDGAAYSLKRDCGL